VNISEVAYTIIGGLGISIFTSSFVLMGISHYIKSHAEKFNSENLDFIKPKLHNLLRKLYIEHIFESMTEIDYLSEISKSNKDKEITNKLDKFKKNLIKFLSKDKDLKPLKEDLKDIVETFVLDPKSHSRIKNKAKNILDLVKEHDFLEKLFEESYTFEIKESNNIFTFSIALLILGLTIIAGVLCNCYTAILSGGNIDLFYLLLLLELYALGMIGLGIRKNHKKKGECQNKILKMKRETLDISPIEK